MLYLYLLQFFSLISFSRNYFFLFLVNLVFGSVGGVDYSRIRCLRGVFSDDVGEKPSTSFLNCGAREQLTEHRENSKRHREEIMLDTAGTKIATRLLKHRTIDHVKLYSGMKVYP